MIFAADNENGVSVPAIFTKAGIDGTADRTDDDNVDGIFTCDAADGLDEITMRPRHGNGNALVMISARTRRMQPELLSGRWNWPQTWRRSLKECAYGSGSMFVV